jgi:hypothetical protein
MMTLRILIVITVLAVGQLAMAEEYIVEKFGVGEEGSITFDALKGMACHFKCKEYGNDLLCASKSGVLFGDCEGKYTCELHCDKITCRDKQLQAAKDLAAAIENGQIFGYEVGAARERLEEAFKCDD